MAYKRGSPQPVTEGGSGAQTFTAHGVLLGEGTSAFGVTAAGTTGQVLTGVTGSDPTWQSPAASSISITGNTGGALTGNAFTFTGGTTGLSFGGSGTTETLSGTLVVSNGGTGAATLTGVLVGNGTSAVTGNAVTNHNVLVGGTSNAITSVAPSASSGIPLVSGGSSADPSFTTAVVAGGGTGATSLTAYAVICGGTTSTGALQSVASVGTSGQVLTSNGAGALPTFQAAGSGGGNSVLYGPANFQLTQGGTTTYIVPGTPGSTTIINNFYFPKAGTISNLYVYARVNNSTTNVNVTVYKNGSSTALLATVTASTTGTFTDLTHSVSVAAGDYFYWVIDGSTTGVITGQVLMNFNG
jgi:hypothetical protein